jgi:4-diphosphocytidyl-2-C-methyl-D-erythritol kinase
MKILTINAPAKVNLGLEVLNKRPDGFHSINSVLTRIPVYDKITLKSCDELKLECDVELGIRQEDNLAYKAARLTLDALEIKEGILIQLRKQIPVGAGLGGGSSDAASVMRGICSFFNIDPNPELLMDIAKSLGSDVPFFLKEGSAIAKGRGEELEYFDFTIPWWTLVVYPNIHINTGEAYNKLNRTESTERNQTDYKKFVTKLKDFPSLYPLIFRNDFEYPNMDNFAEMMFIRKKIYDAGAFFSLMSGSGSSYFGFFDDPKKIENTKRYFEQYKTFVGKF